MEENTKTTIRERLNNHIERHRIAYSLVAVYVAPAVIGAAIGTATRILVERALTANEVIDVIETTTDI